MSERDGRFRLLVSVRSVGEATEALSGGADIVDVKEPSRGALGQAPRRVVEEISRTLAGRAPASAALGELRDWPEGRFAAPVPGVELYKLGPSGMASRDWQRRLGGWRRFFETRAAGRAALVAVAYADWQQSRSPRPEEIILEASRSGLRHLLLDTFYKDAGGILDLVAREVLGTWITAARDASLQVALAGSLKPEQMQDALALSPDIVAVRTAATLDGTRHGDVHRFAVERLRDRAVRRASDRCRRAARGSGPATPE